MDINMKLILPHVHGQQAFTMKVEEIGCILYLSMNQQDHCLNFKHGILAALNVLEIAYVLF